MKSGVDGFGVHSMPYEAPLELCFHLLLFATFLIPVLLLLFPPNLYISKYGYHWSSLSVMKAAQQILTRFEPVL